jgi:hypothetical protein
MVKGRLTLPMEESERRVVFNIRQGRKTLAEVVELLESLEADIEGALKWDHIPAHANQSQIARFLANAYLSTWERAAA